MRQDASPLRQQDLGLRSGGIELKVPLGQVIQENITYVNHCFMIAGGKIDQRVGSVNGDSLVSIRGHLRNTDK